jgi:hypothetical protein
MSDNQSNTKEQDEKIMDAKAEQELANLPRQDNPLTSFAKNQVKSVLKKEIIAAILPFLPAIIIALLVFGGIIFLIGIYRDTGLSPTINAKNMCSIVYDQVENPSDNCRDNFQSVYSTRVANLSTPTPTVSTNPSR